MIERRPSVPRNGKFLMVGYPLRYTPTSTIAKLIGGMKSSSASPRCCPARAQFTGIVNEASMYNSNELLWLSYDTDRILQREELPD